MQHSPVICLQSINLQQREPGAKVEVLPCCKAMHTNALLEQCLRLQLCQEWAPLSSTQPWTSPGFTKPWKVKNGSNRVKKVGKRIKQRMRPDPAKVSPCAAPRDQRPFLNSWDRCAVPCWTGHSSSVIEEWKWTKKLSLSGTRYCHNSYGTVAILSTGHRVGEKLLC